MDVWFVESTQERVGSMPGNKYSSASVSRGCRDQVRSPRREGVAARARSESDEKSYAGRESMRYGRNGSRSDVNMLISCMQRCV